MYELLRNGEPVDRAPLANLEQAKIFFMKRKQMTEEQFDELGYSVRLVEPKKRYSKCNNPVTNCYNFTIVILPNIP